MSVVSFHPQVVFLPNLSVNLRACLCGVVNYASAQALDFLDLGQKSFSGLETPKGALSW
jgi:hypothetical protein